MPCNCMKKFLYPVWGLTPIVRVTSMVVLCCWLPGGNWWSGDIQMLTLAAVIASIPSHNTTVNTRRLKGSLSGH